MKSLLPVINAGLPTDLVQPFAARVARDATPLRRRAVEQLQINLGKLCNQTCTHCHVEAGPTKKRENMDAKTAARVVELARNCRELQVVDLTGGAPEMNPGFRGLVQEFRRRGVRVIDRCNLTILRQPGFEWAAPFWRTIKSMSWPRCPAIWKTTSTVSGATECFGKALMPSAN